METVFVILVILLQIYIGIAASIGNLKKKGDLSYPRNLTSWGWTLMISCILCFGLSIALYFINKDTQEIRDIIAERKRVESNKEIFKALAEYNLQYSDSLKKVIEIVKDSAKRTTNIFPEIEPVFKLNFKPVSLDSSKESYRYFSIILMAYKGEIYNASASMHIIKKSGSEYSLIRGPELNGIENQRVTEGEEIFLHANLYASQGVMIYFYVKGAYTNNKKSKKYLIDEICGFDFKNMNSGMPNARDERDIRSFLKAKGVIN